MKSPPTHYESGCAGKARFDERTARGIVARDSVREAYRCRWCDGWHIGGRRKAKTPAMVKAEIKRARLLFEEVA